MNYHPRQSLRETIATGVGRYPCDIPTSMTPEEASAWMSNHCVCPELYQDIVNMINNSISSDQRKLNLYKANMLAYEDRHYVLHCSIVPEHKLMKVHIKRMDRLYRYNTYFDRPVSVHYLRITADGLIADIYEDGMEPKYNPGNLITVMHGPRTVH